MTSTPPPIPPSPQTATASDAAFVLRAPAPAFGVLGLALMFACAALAFAWAASDFRGLNLFSLRVLMIPALIGTGLAAISIGPKLAKLKSVTDIVWRAAAAFAAAGFAWPLSFALALMLQGDPQSAAASILPALAGLTIGAIAGAASGAAAATLCLKRI